VLSIDMSPVVLVFINMVVQSAICSGRGETHGDDCMTMGELRAALAAAEVLHQRPQDATDAPRALGCPEG